MARADRLKLIQAIEAERKSRLIVAIWGDRQNHETVIAPDAHAIFFDHLQKFGKVTKIDVLLYSTGGHTLAAWGLANLVREYCDEVGVLIPHRALSAATLFTLSANEIVMSRLGQLSPIDPSITTPLGPNVQVPTQPGQFRVVPISVEDVVGFFDLAKDSARLRDSGQLLQIFERLADKVHPLALGAVYRSRQQIQTLADRLLSLHMKGDARKKDRERVVSILTRELGSHDYLIGRTEARDYLKLNVINVTSTLESNILSLFNEYASLLDLRIPYNPEGFLGNQAERTGDFNRAIIETADLTHVFRTSKTVRRVQMQQMGMVVPGAQEIASFEGWVNDQTV